jgi:hypothetical protein
MKGIYYFDSNSSSMRYEWTFWSLGFLNLQATDFFLHYVLKYYRTKIFGKKTENYLATQLVLHFNEYQPQHKRCIKDGFYAQRYLSVLLRFCYLNRHH